MQGREYECVRMPSEYESVRGLEVEDLQLQCDFVALVEFGAVLRQRPRELHRPF